GAWLFPAMPASPDTLALKAKGGVKFRDRRLNSNRGRMVNRWLTRRTHVMTFVRFDIWRFSAKPRRVVERRIDCCQPMLPTSTLPAANWWVNRASTLCCRSSDTDGV